MRIVVNVLVLTGMMMGVGYVAKNYGPDTAGALVMVGILVVSYFLPTIVAVNRRHNNRLAIFALNFFAGWTLVGWVVAIVWSCTRDTEEPNPVQLW